MKTHLNKIESMLVVRSPSVPSSLAGIDAFICRRSSALHSWALVWNAARPALGLIPLDGEDMARAAKRWLINRRAIALWVLG